MSELIQAKLQKSGSLAVSTHHCHVTHLKLSLDRREMWIASCQLTLTKIFCINFRFSAVGKHFYFPFFLFIFSSSVTEQVADYVEEREQAL